MIYGVEDEVRTRCFSGNFFHPFPSGGKTRNPSNPDGIFIRKSFEMSKMGTLQTGAPVGLLKKLILPDGTVLSAMADVTYVAPKE